MRRTRVHRLHHSTHSSSLSPPPARGAQSPPRMPGLRAGSPRLRSRLRVAIPRGEHEASTRQTHRWCGRPRPVRAPGRRGGACSLVLRVTSPYVSRVTSPEYPVPMSSLDGHVPTFLYAFAFDEKRVFLQVTSREHAGVTSPRVVSAPPCRQPCVTRTPSAQRSLPEWRGGQSAVLRVPRFCI